MDAMDLKRMEKAGWSVCDAADFLSLSPEEAALVEMREGLSRSLKARRLATGLTPTNSAKQLGSSQSRAATFEATDPNVSLELLSRAHLAFGASRRNVASAPSQQVA